MFCDAATSKRRSPGLPAMMLLFTLPRFGQRPWPSGTGSSHITQRAGHEQLHKHRVYTDCRKERARGGRGRQELVRVREKVEEKSLLRALRSIASDSRGSERCRVHSPSEARRAVRYLMPTTLHPAVTDVGRTTLNTKHGGYDSAAGTVQSLNCECSCMS